MDKNDTEEVQMQQRIILLRLQQLLRGKLEELGVGACVLYKSIEGREEYRIGVK